MNLDAVTDLLERRIGLDPASLGPTVLPAAVADRMRALGLADPAAYAGRLAGWPEEFDALVERLIVPETSFFRGGGLFDELARRVAASLPVLGGRPFRALSLPCSTGEEPYSLAIALLEAGLDPQSWVIDGIDLSPRLVEAARRGAYREFAFRQTKRELRDRYFLPVADAWELGPPVRGLVRFRVGNVLDAALAAAPSEGYDLVLCRNLLIYLTAAARRQALATLERLLMPGGLLAVGHAEPQILAGRPFRRCEEAQYFLFRNDPSAAPPSTLPRTRADAKPGVAVVPRPAKSRKATPRPEPVPLTSAPAEGPLARARRLADDGRLEDALAECRKGLEHGGASADAYCLLGVIQQARGDESAAAEAFRKALYLAPNHGEALAHAMLLSARRGDLGHAAALRERLARLGAGGKP
jgi:chemotaxis protein methyltransferase WspC